MSRDRRCAARSSGPSPSRSRWSSVTRTGQPPAGGVPATAMSPPRQTRTPRAESRRRCGERRDRPRTPCRSLRGRARRRAGSGSSDARGRAARAASSVVRRRRRTTCRRPSSLPISAKSQSYPSERSEPPTVGSTAPPVASAARSAVATASKRMLLTPTGAAGAGVHGVQLRARQEAAARPVDRVELLVQDGARPPELRTIGDRHLGRRTERGEAVGRRAPCVVSPAISRPSRRGDGRVVRDRRHVGGGGQGLRRAVVGGRGVDRRQRADGGASRPPPSWRSARRSRRARRPRRS